MSLFIKNESKVGSTKKLINIANKIAMPVTNPISVLGLKDDVASKANPADNIIVVAKMAVPDTSNAYKILSRKDLLLWR